jgi:hypothetical protein
MIDMIKTMVRLLREIYILEDKLISRIKRESDADFMYQCGRVVIGCSRQRIMCSIAYRNIVLWIRENDIRGIIGTSMVMTQEMIDEVKYEIARELAKCEDYLTYQLDRMQKIIDKLRQMITAIELLET